MAGKSIERDTHTGKAMRCHNNELMMASGIESSISSWNGSSIHSKPSMKLIWIRGFVRKKPLRWIPLRWEICSVRFDNIVRYCINSVIEVNRNQHMNGEKREKPNTNLIVSRYRLMWGWRRAKKNECGFWVSCIPRIHSWFRNFGPNCVRACRQANRETF